MPPGPPRRSQSVRPDNPAGTHQHSRNGRVVKHLKREDMESTKPSRQSSWVMPVDSRQHRKRQDDDCKPSDNEALGNKQRRRANPSSSSRPVRDKAAVDAEILVRVDDLEEIDTSSLPTSVGIEVGQSRGEAGKPTAAKSQPDDTASLRGDIGLDDDRKSPEQKPKQATQSVTGFGSGFGRRRRLSRRRKSSVTKVAVNFKKGTGRRRRGRAQSAKSRSSSLEQPDATPIPNADEGVQVSAMEIENL